MPSTYTGVPANATPGSPLAITEPVDADPQSAATVNVPFGQITDLLEYVRRASRPDCPAVSQQTWINQPAYAGTSATAGDLSLIYPAALVPVATAPDAAYNRPAVVLGAPAATNLSTIASKSALFRWLNPLRARFEVELSMSAAGANNLQIVAGFGAAGGVAITHFNGAVFSKLSTDTNWQCYTDDGTTRTANQTGYVATAPTANVSQRLRIDCFGAAVSGGARAEFYIDDVLVCTNTSTLGLNSVNLFAWVFIGNTLAGANANTIRVGPLTLRF